VDWRRDRDDRLVLLLSAPGKSSIPSLGSDLRQPAKAQSGLALTGMAGKLVAETIAGQAERFDLFSRIKHRPFPGGALMRTPALVLGMLYFRLRDLL
jgi:hypothetical protein